MGGGHRPGTKRRKKFLVVPLHVFGSKSAISRFGERFCDGQYSFVSFVFAVLLLAVPPCPAICKSGGTCPPCPMESAPLVKSFPSHALGSFGWRWSPNLWPSARHQPKLQHHGQGTSVSHGVLVYSPAYDITKLCCSVREANACKRLAQGRQSTVQRLGLNPRSPIASPTP